jgi:hypothetical protein
MLADFEAAVPANLRGGTLESARHAIRAMIALAEDRPDDALAEFRLVDQPGCPTCFNPFIGLAHDRAGRPDSAIAVWERYLETPQLARVLVDWSWLGRIYFRLGQLHENRGDRARAVEYYRLLVDLWETADPILQPTVSEARAGIARLAADR